MKCPNCLCCNFESNGSSRNYGCAGLCEFNHHTAQTNRARLGEAVEVQLREWAEKDRALNDLAFGVEKENA